MDEDIRMRGMLYQYQHRFVKKWRKVWCVLSADSMNSAARLELYEFRQASVNEGLSGKRSEGKKVILLRDCVQIGQKDSGDCPKNCGSFQLETTSKIFTFATQVPDVQSWVKELCRLAFPMTQAEGRSAGQAAGLHPPGRDQAAVEMKENSLYETAASMRDFLVIAMGTEAALRCQLYGEYILTPNDDRILLKDHKTKHVIFSWPYCFIRKFGQDRLSFSFEAGRRCETGEGNFEFTTNQGDRIFRIVSGAIQDLPQSEKPGSKSRPVEKAEPVPQSVEDACVYSTVNQTGPDSEGPEAKALPNPKQHPVKKLTPSFRSLSLNAIEPPIKGQVRSINSCPSSSSSTAQSAEEPLYAMVTKPRLPNEPKSDPWQGVNDYVHQLGPLPDPLEDLDYSPAEESREMLQSDLLPQPFELRSDDFMAESVYSEAKEFDGRASWQVLGEYHFPEDMLGQGEAPDSGEEQAEGFSTYDNLMSRGKKL